MNKDFKEKIGFKLPEEAISQVTSKDALHAKKSTFAALMDSVSKMNPEEWEKYKTTVEKENFIINDKVDEIVLATFLLKQNKEAYEEYENFIKEIKQKIEEIQREIEKLRLYIDANREKISQKKLHEFILLLCNKEKTQREIQSALEQELKNFEEVKKAFDSTLELWNNIECDKRDAKVDGEIWH